MSRTCHLRWVPGPSADRSRMSVPYPRVVEPADAGEPCDIDLMARVRAGSGETFGLLS